MSNITSGESNLDIQWNQQRVRFKGPIERLSKLNLERFKYIVIL